MGLQGEVRCVFTEIQDLTRFKRMNYTPHNHINNPHLQKVAKRLSGLMDTTNIEGTVCAYLQEYEVRILETLTRIVLRTGLKPRRRAMCRRDYDRGGELRRISTHRLNEIIKEKIGFSLRLRSRWCRTIWYYWYERHTRTSDLTPAPSLMLWHWCLLVKLGEYELHFDNKGSESLGRRRF
jgi:hypothetical protein